MQRSWRRTLRQEYELLNSLDIEIIYPFHLFLATLAFCFEGTASKSRPDFWDLSKHRKYRDEKLVHSGKKYIISFRITQNSVNRCSKPQGNHISSPLSLLYPQNARFLDTHPLKPKTIYSNIQFTPIQVYTASIKGVLTTLLTTSDNPGYQGR